MTSSCPKCGSKKMKYTIHKHQYGNVQKCGYTGYIAIEDDNLEKPIKQAKKMEKLSKKIMKWR